MALYLGILNNGTFVTSDGYSLQDANGLSLVAFSEITKRKIIINNVIYRANINLSTKESE